MNDETERLKGTHLATQGGCRHWAPIVPRDAPEETGQNPVAKQVESIVPPAEKTPD